MVIFNTFRQKPNSKWGALSVLLTGFFVFLSLSSCALGTVYQEVLLGNMSFSRGEYQDATVYYLAALKEKSVHDPWIAYNLGNVYHSLGEVKSAFEMWDKAAQTTDQQVLFSVSFNKGIAWYEMGKYEDALKNFREAVELNPSNVEAKLNLELAQQKLQAAAGHSALQGQSGVSPQTPEDAVRLLEYIRRKEELQWKAPKASLTENQGPVNDW